MTHEPGIIHTWTFDQERTWIDVNGVEHDIALIGSDYATNVLLFLLRGASRFKRAYVVQQHSTFSAFASLNSDAEWMETRPLFKALKRRLQHGPQTAFTVKGA
jgi:hypothetical protein